MEMTERCAVFSCLGMGDGLIALVLSNNLHLNGRAVTTFHPFLDSLQAWFPHLPIRRFPRIEELEADLKQFDRFFIIYEKSPWMQSVLAHSQKHFPNQTTILNPIATPRRDYLHWEKGRFDGNRAFVENLYTFCKDILKFAVVTKSNGICNLEGVCPQLYKKRVVIHPCSSREGKNWPRKKFLKLACRLKELGYIPSLLLTKEERRGWDLNEVDAPLFLDMSALTSFISESGYMIGNDSGIGHLASCLGLPTLTICRSLQTSKFWRPAWARAEVITPSAWVPNLKGLRWRDKHWKRWITVNSVLNRFNQLVNF
jgi:heptosyltransferase-3